MVIGATATWRLTLLLAFPAGTLVAWQMPPLKRIRHSAASQPLPGLDRGQGALCLRVLSLNVQAGSVDPAIVVRNLERYKVDVLAVQELSQGTVHRLADAGVTDLLPFCHLDPRPGSAGTGIWARWPLVPLSPLPGLIAAAPRARIDLPGGRTVTLTAVHPTAPVRGEDRRWEEELVLIRATLAGTDGPQVVAGDFNASRDHRPFRDLLAAGFLDCADAAQKRSWPGFTWPVGRAFPPVMRLDHVLVSRAGATVRESRVVRVPGTDHRGVLAVVEL
jgi:endonuclease/exonuclease/phosphatase (EEP) superfamily protein YafD